MVVYIYIDIDIDKYILIMRMISLSAQGNSLKHKWQLYSFGDMTWRHHRQVSKISITLTQVGPSGQKLE